MRTGTVISMAVQQMVCTACGSEANASCNCGKPYVPKKQRAAEWVEANPNKSNRTGAAEIGVDERTIRRARETGAALSAALSAAREDERRLGRDGKIYRLPERDDRSESEIEAEHEEGLRVVAVRGFINRAREAQEIATLGKLVASDITEARAGIVFQA